MARKFLTLRISENTDINKAVHKLELLLADAGSSNISLNKLLLDTAHRFKAELLQTTTINAKTSPTEAGPATKVNSGKTLIRGDGYSILITTRPETFLSRLVDQLLRRPPAIT